MNLSFPAPAALFTQHQASSNGGLWETQWGVSGDHDETASDNKVVLLRPVKKKKKSNFQPKVSPPFWMDWGKG